MKAVKAIATYRRMRTQPLWRLLASDKGPVVIALLQSHLYENERSLPASMLYERIERELETLQSQGDAFPQTAQSYVANWLADGFLVRHFPQSSTEEEYELSTAAEEAIRFVSGMEQPHSAATESRLALVIQALVKLAEDTDDNQSRRIERLLNEHERISREIDTIKKGHMHVLSAASALERIREIISLADDLAGDFHRVRDKFEQLNRSLRERLMDDEGNRGEVLGSIFAGMDLISESDAGRTFNAFWQLLTDHEQSATLDQALGSVMSREFINDLDNKDRRFLLRITRTLLDQGTAVHGIMQTFAKSLNRFVRSREYLKQRRLNQLLKEAHSAALALKDKIKTTDDIRYSLELTSSRVRSLSQLLLYDPSLRALQEGMNEGDAPSIDLESVGALVAESEIDFRTLKANVRNVLEMVSQASVGKVLEQYPATQGLGSVVGLIALGSRHGYTSQSRETVTWTGNDEVKRRAQIQKLFFVRERIDELV
ncbi:MAG: DUF3375 domain-containing protein [Treponema sp.]|jgi:hypothetical protein|nr:DUF3375 domain-containing protein [Treponema sp.]